MQRATRVWEKQVREAIDEDPNLASYVRRLEEAAEERHDEGGTLGEIPSGEQIAEELERFLRDERGGST
jgi:hypothetical protein